MEKFKKLANDSIKRLSLQESYDTKDNPSSVARIITSYRYRKDALNLLFSFTQLNPKSNSLKEYVRFVRSLRNEMFPNTYKNNSGKFISIFGLRRTTTLDEFIERHLKR